MAAVVLVDGVNKDFKVVAMPVGGYEVVVVVGIPEAVWCSVCYGYLFGSRYIEDWSAVLGKT